MNNDPQPLVTENKPSVEKGTGLLGKLKNLFAIFWTKVPLPIKAGITKFTSNKKIFLPVTISLGAIFLVIILGLIFGGGSAKPAPKKSPTPTPVVQKTPEASESGDVISINERKLNALKNQIKTLDVNQSRLQLPPIDFEISF